MNFYRRVLYVSCVCDWQIQPSQHVVLATSCVPTTAASTAPTSVMEIRTAWTPLMKKTVVRTSTSPPFVALFFIYVG